jgi:hypothetical protein
MSSDTYADSVSTNPQSHTLETELNRFVGWNNRRRLEYLAKRKVKRRFRDANIYSKGVYLLDNGIVAKHLDPNMSGFVLWKNEINALKRVVGEIHFPQLIAADPINLIIYMTYCGPSLSTGAKIPPNWKRQVENIKNSLIRRQMNPNDILPRNICVWKGTLKIIDFGLSNARHPEIVRSVDKLKRLLTQYST